MDFEDAPSEKPTKVAIFFRRLQRFFKRVFRRPTWALPQVVLEEDLNESERPWRPFILWIERISAVLALSVVITSVVLLSRNWNSPCLTPLNAFILVCACLFTAWEVLFLVTIKNFGVVTIKIFLTIVSVALSAWGIVGIVWLAQSSAAGCMTTSPVLFGLSVAYVILFTLPMFLFFIYMVLQLLANLLLKVGVVKGVTAMVLTGKRPFRSSGNFLGVSVLGDKRTGKTSILRGLNKDAKTILPKGWSCRVIDENPSRFTLKASRVTIGEEDPTLQPLRTTDLVNADCVVVCFNLMDKRSFQSIKTLWLSHVVANCSVPIVLVGTTNTQEKQVTIVRRPEKLDASILPAPAEATTDQQRDFLRLPTSVWLRVFDFLPNNDLLHAQEVCKLWKELGRHSFVWKGRSTGQVTKGQVAHFMKEVRQLGVLKDSGFSGISGYFEVDFAHTDVASLWKRVIQLVLLNESKVKVWRGPQGRLEFGRAVVR